MLIITLGGPTFLQPLKQAADDGAAPRGENGLVVLGQVVRRYREVRAEGVHCTQHGAISAAWAMPQAMPYHAREKATKLLNNVNKRCILRPKGAEIRRSWQRCRCMAGVRAGADVEALGPLGWRRARLDELGRRIPPLQISTHVSGVRWKQSLLCSMPILSVKKWGGPFLESKGLQHQGGCVGFRDVIQGVVHAARQARNQAGENTFLQQ